MARKSQIKFYDILFDNYEKDDELDEKEILVLDNMQKELALSQEEVKYYDNILPYKYAQSIRKNDLGTVELNLVGGSPVILKKNEIVHFVDSSVLKEVRVVRIGYSGGSRGISIRIAKGIRYHVGGHRGHVMKEEQLVPTSSGALVLTNQRICYTLHQIIKQSRYLYRK